MNFFAVWFLNFAMRKHFAQQLDINDSAEVM
jgi:hypothetical protein